MSVNIEIVGGFTAIVDDEDAELVRSYRWRLSKTRRSVYAQAEVKTEKGRTTLYMHRLILLRGARTDTVVDHINGNGLDNRRSNLRECSVADNTRNKKAVISTNSSGCTGVHWHKDKQGWVAAIVIGSKRKHLGRFKDKEAAIEARRKAEQLYYGEFAPTFTPPALQARQG